MALFFLLQIVFACTVVQNASLLQIVQLVVLKFFMSRLVYKLSGKNLLVLMRSSLGLPLK
ncbi:hypothetical protein Sjap_002363 [Stephania japonica]|uniref:Uncharacterized protein n=1 Tax=Stephania japonica TaxID=461633 RepID=A0AAP0PSG4_9MAGN